MLARVTIASLLAILGADSARAEGPSCAELARAETSAPALEPAAVDWAKALWASVEAAHRRLDPAFGSPRLALIDRPEASGWYCRGTDVIYLSAPLVDYAWLGRHVDGKELVAFVLAHELAHRRFDPADKGRAALSADGCRGPAFERERDADLRAAFLVALTADPERGRSLSPWRLERQATLARFIESEHGGGCSDGRAGALADALRTMEGLGDVYEVALGLALAPIEGAARPRALALALLERLDLQLNPSGSWARVPELAHLRALLHVKHASALAGVSCELAFARFGGLAPFDAVGQRAGSAEPLAEALAAARLALSDARRRALPEARIAPLAACLKRVEAGPGPASDHTATVLVAPATAAPPPDLEPLVALAEAPCGNRPSSFRRMPLGGGLTLETHARDDFICHELVADRPMRLALFRPPDATTASLASWRAHCEFVGEGRADDGSAAWGLRCPAVDRGPSEGWTVLARGDRVVQIGRLVGLDPRAP